jgi:hypothetical protein
MLEVAPVAIVEGYVNWTYNYKDKATFLKQNSYF